MNKALTLSVLMLGMSASAETVLWYSFDAGGLNEKTVSGGTIANRALNGDMPAVPHALINSKELSEDNTRANWATYVEGFDAVYHVYDPVSQTTVQTIDRALDFRHSGGSILTVANDARLRSQPMTVEAFVQFPQGSTLNSWNVIAVQPAFMPCVNADAWGFRFTSAKSLVARFTPSQTFSANVNATGNVEVTATVNVNDGNWHHVAFTVDENNMVKVYFDYELKVTKTLAFPVQFTDAENCPLMIGATLQTSGAFMGKMNEFRLSNAVLTPESFIRKMSEGFIENLDPATLIWYSFGDLPVWNRGNSASYSGLLNVRTVSDETYPKPQIQDVWSACFRQSFAATDEITNCCSLYNSYGESEVSRNIAAYLYANNLPDVFTNTSFTIECVIKADGEIGQFTPFVRRKGGGNVQLNLGVGNSVGCLSAMLLPEGSSASDSISLNDTSGRIDDGAWHHVALVRNKEAGKVYLYRDYSKVATATCTSPLYPTAEPLTFAGTTSGNAFKGWMDEVRITMKALTAEQFITNERTRTEGDVWAHVTFDGTMEAKEFGSVTAAKVGDGNVPAYSGDVPAKYVCDERGQEGRRLNTQSLRLDGGAVKYFGTPWLRSDEAQTIEFFVKGEAQGSYAPVIRFGYSEGDTATPVWSLSSVAASPTGLFMTRWDIMTDGETRKPVSRETSITLFDGKWHHVALTFAPNSGDVSKSDIAVWKDYKKVFSETVGGRVAYDQTAGMLWLGYNGKQTFTGWIDELRITKGVIDSEKFLRAKNFSGLVIICR